MPRIPPKWTAVLLLRSASLPLLCLPLAGCRSLSPSRHFVPLAKVQDERPMPDGVALLRVVNRAGRVSLVGWDGDTIRIEADVHVDERRAGQVRPGAFADYVLVTFSGDGAQVSDAHAGHADADHWRLDLSIRLPRHLAVEADVSAGDVRIEAVRGAVVVRCAAGAVEVRADEVESIRATVSTGSVEVAARTLGGPLKADVTAGKVAVRLAEPPAHEIDLSSTVGEVDLDLPEGSPGVYSLSAEVGDISISGLAGLTVQRAMTRATVEGQVGAGGPKIRAACATGKISIR